MGRFFAKPDINWNHNFDYKPPKLKWHKIIYNCEHAGEILASFELIYYEVINQ